MWYNNKVARKRDKNWSLKIEQQERSTKRKAWNGSRKILTDENTTQQKVKEAKSKTRKQKVRARPSGGDLIKWFREFDPGSGWTLAACITHSSRTDEGLRPRVSGGRVSNAWATCPFVRDNVWKRTLIPHNAWESHVSHAKDLLQRDGLASD